MNKYRLTTDAQNDLIRIFRYGVETFGFSQAEHYYNILFDHFDLISKNPYAFESINNISSSYRRCVCGSNSIYYKINNDMVEIIAIVGKQDLQHIF